MVKLEKVYKYFVYDCSITNLVYELPHELPNNLKLRILGD